MFAFSTCWNSRRHTDGRAMLAEVRALGFEHAELGHATQVSLLDGIRRAVAGGEIKICSLHNFCPLPPGLSKPAPDCFLPSTRREHERELAVTHTLRTLDCAASLGAKAVVIHLGRVRMRRYTQRLVRLSAKGRQDTPRFQRLWDKALDVRARKRGRYFDQVCRTLEAIVPKARQLGVTLGLETRWGIEEIPDADETAQLLTRFGDDVIAYWHDVGHAAMKEHLGFMRQETILTRFRGRTAGMHLQDFTPPAWDHLPPGRGTLDFTRLAPFVTDAMPLVWELHPDTSAEEIVATRQQAQEQLCPRVSI